MDFGAVIEIIFAVTAFIGIACLGHYLSEVFFLPREIVTAVKIFDERSRENADTLLYILKHGLWRRAGKDACVLLSERYADDEELVALINESGVKYYIIEDHNF